MALLRHDLSVGDAVDIDNGRVVVRLESKSGQKASLSFDADRSVPIRKVAKPGSAAAMARQGLRPLK